MADSASPSLPALFAAADAGDAQSSTALFTALYGELHRIASRELHRHGWGVSLGVTSLLHDAYFELAGRDGAQFPDQQRFMGYAARVMRGLIIDYARQRAAVKRGGRFELTTLSGDAQRVAEAPNDLGRIGAVLDDLHGMDPLLAEIVDLKYFCGFTFEEIAAMKGLSDRTVRRHWTKARAFLHAALQGPLED